MGIRKILRREIGPGRPKTPALPEKHPFTFPVKIWFDTKTRIIFQKIGSQAGKLSITGLINCKTGQIHMMPECFHDSLAVAKGLKKTDITLKDNWYGFKLACENSVLKVSPWSNLFGLIPIKYGSIFEGWIRDLFSDKLKNGELKKVLFCKFKY
jgi:hypothetical protein